MSAMPVVRVQLGQDGTGSVTIGGSDISHVVMGVDITARPGAGAEALLRTRAEGEIEAYGRVDQATAAALIDLGWTPPDNPPTRGVAPSGNQ